jgi:predicted enzyme related to lactoylglutathione lyase
MAIIQDPSGAYLGLWQAGKMQGSQTEGASSMGWAELNARGFHKAESFYKNLFGWGEKKTPASAENPTEYTEFQAGGQSIAGGMEMNPMVPAEVPSYWMVYFNVDNVDKAFDKVIAEGGKEMLSPMDMPGGRFAIVSDPQGASFGLLKMEESSR